MAVAYPKTNEERAKLYLHCMVEIRERIQITRALTDWRVSPLFVRELCYLQLRHVCEVIAIACLAAQGDFETQRAFRDEYAPPKIFNAIRELYPDFFPRPAIRFYKPGNPGRHHIETSVDYSAYAEADVSDLWNKSGDRLHRLSTAKYLKKAFKPEEASLDDIRLHVEGLWNLLKGHMILIEKNDPKLTFLHVEVEHSGGPFHAHFLYLDKETSSIRVESWQANIL